MGTITSIVIQPPDREYGDPFGDFLRVPRHEALLIADHGIEGDRKARSSRTRQVNLLTADWVARMAELGYRAAPGQFGEQLVISGVDFADLQPGVQLELGDGAVLEITKPRTGCERLQAAQGREIPPEINWAIGYLARVLEGGRIRVGDPVRVRETTAA